MAKENAPQEAQAVAAAAPKAAGSIPFTKLIMIGVPVFIVQFALIYFLTAKFLVNPSHGGPVPAVEKTEENKEKEGKESAVEVYVIKDIIINPAGTNGTRFLLTTIGVEVSNAEARAEIEKKDMQVRDALNTILTTKGLAELNGLGRDHLRTEILEKLSELVKSGKIKNVYFSKFIIQ
jgi:flagellar FliL protein